MGTRNLTSDCARSHIHSNRSRMSGLIEALKADGARFAREFYTPEPISMTGNYYPRYRITGTMETGSAHISYLSRPYYSYKVPSKYGFSKYITVRKLRSLKNNNAASSLP